MAKEYTLSTKSIVKSLQELYAQLRVIAVPELVRQMKDIERRYENIVAKESGKDNRRELDYCRMELLRVKCLILSRSGTFLDMKDPSDELIELSKKYVDEKYSANALFLRSRVRVAQANYTDAEKCLLEAIDKFAGLGEWFMLGCCYNEIAKLYNFSLHRYDLALRYFLELDSLAAARSDVALLQNSALLGLHVVYFRLEDMVEARKALDKAARVIDENPDYYSQVVLHNSYSLLARRESKHDESIEHLLKAKFLSTEYKDYSLLSSILLSLGHAYFELERFDELATVLDEAEQLARSYNQHEQLASTHLLKASMLSSKRNSNYDPSLAAEHFRISIALAEEHALIHFQSEALKEFVLFHKQLGNWREALEHLEKATMLYEQVFAEDRRKQINELETGYQLRLKEQEAQILALEKQQLQQQAEHLQVQLTMKTQAMVEQMKAIQALRNGILESTKHLNTAEELLRQVRSILNDSPLMRQDWDAFLETFSQVHPTFSRDLLARFPDLTKMEVRICLLIRADLNSEQVADLLSLSVRNIENHRYRLRKKMGLQRGDSLETALNF